MIGQIASSVNHMTDHIRTFGLLQPATNPPTEAHSGHSICIPGMGIGATPDAIRWATIGYLNELLRDYEKINAAPVGRPTSEFMDKVPQRRAFMLWALVNKYQIGHNLRYASNRELIDVMLLLRNFGPCIAKYFPNTTDNLEPSISRGRSILCIGPQWQSQVCEKVYTELFAND
jgi:hypothetical protein